MSPEVIMGGPISSGPIPPWARAIAGRMTMGVKTIALILHRLWSSEIGDELLNCVMYVIMTSHRLDVASDRPYRQISSDKLANPVAEKGSRTAERERDVLRLTQETAQCTAFDQS